MNVVKSGDFKTVSFQFARIAAVGVFAMHAVGCGPVREYKVEMRVEGAQLVRTLTLTESGGAIEVSGDSSGHRPIHRNAFIGN